MHTFTIGKLVVRQAETRTDMGEDAAAMVAERINDLLSKKAYINIVFAAAPSQNEFLKALKTKALDWTRINAFHMDEYIGLDKNAPQGFGNFLKERLFAHLPFKSVHYLDGNAADAHAACQNYAHLLLENPVDIVCMGIGENGHIAFNDPPVADFQDKLRVKTVELDAICRQQQVNDGCFSALTQVPTHALTLTIPALMSAEFIYCIVPAPSKAVAVFNTFYKPISEQYPSTILRNQENAWLFLDKDSSRLVVLKKTVNDSKAVHRYL
jgi:glucosamine-6-phosphate deaminase